MVNLTRRDGRDTPLYVNGRNVIAVEPDEHDTSVVYTAAGAWRVLERFDWIVWALGTQHRGDPGRYGRTDPYPEAVGPEAVPS